MKNSWLVLPVLLLLLFITEKSFAQQEVLDSLIRMTLKNNPDLKSASFLQQSADYNYKASGSLPDPTITIGALNLPVNSFSLDKTPMSGINLGLSQKLPWLGKLNNRKNLAELDSRLAGTQVDIYKNKLIRQVTDAYLDYSYWSLSIPIIEEFLDLLDATREVAEVRYENGDAPAQDMLRISSLFSRTEVRLLNAKKMRQTSLINLRQITGNFTLSDSIVSYLTKSEIDYSNLNSIDKNPHFAKASLKIEKSEISRKLSNSDYYPDFVVGIDYRIRKDIPNDPVQGTDFLSFKVGFTLPLWFGKKQSNKTKSAEYMLSASKEQQRSVHDILTAQLNEIQSRLNLETESLDEYDSSILPEARAALDAAEIAYEVGQVDFNGLLTAQKDLFEVKIERLNLLKQFNKSLAVLTELNGNSFER